MTAKTSASLITDAETYIQDNTTRNITPAEVRQRFKDLADSTVNIADLGVLDENDLIQYREGQLTNRTPAQIKTDLALVKGDVGLGNVDNTSDANKPVSTATQTALNLKANLASPTFTGTPTAPTVDLSDNSTKLATSAAAFAYPRRRGDLMYFASAGYNPGVTQADAIVNEMIGALNDGSRSSLEFPVGTTLLSDAFTPTAVGTLSGRDHISISGMGAGSLIKFEAGAGTASQLFKFGVAAGDFALHFDVRGLNIKFENTPGATNALFEGARYARCSIQDILLEGGCKFFHGLEGGSTTIRNVKSEIMGANAGATDSLIFLGDVAVNTLEDILLSDGTKAGDTDADGKYIHIEILEEGSVDTVYINKVACQLNNGLSNGRPYGLLINRPASVGSTFDGSVTNLWVTDSVFDATSIAGFFSNCATNSNSYGTAWYIRGNHFLTLAGKGMVLNGNGNRPYNGVSITDNWMCIKDDNPGMEFAFGPNAKAIEIAGNKVTDSNFSGAEVSKDVAIKVSGNGWNLHDNVIDSHANGATGWGTAIEITSATSGNFRLGYNHAPNIKQYLREPVWSTADPTRIIERPFDKKINSSRWYYRRDDFDAPTIDASWTFVDGSDAQATHTKVTGSVFGFITLATGDADPSALTDVQIMDLNGTQIAWGDTVTRPQLGGMVFETNLTLNSVASISIFAGFTDQHAALEMPFTLSGASLTSNASNAVGFLLDSAGTDPDNWKLVGVKNDVDASIQDSAILGSTAATTLRLIVYPDETAVFQINGRPVGTVMSAACLTSGSYTPCIALFSRTTASKVATVDYNEWGCGRAAG